MSLLQLLNALLVLAGPFVLVAPLAAVALHEFAPARRRTVRFRLPSVSLGAGRWAVA